KRMVYSCEADREYAEEPGFLGFAEQTKISSLNLVQEQRFFYHFDYGENWYFEISVARIGPALETPAPKVLRRNKNMPAQY
ncbi:hypothetical protein J4441_03905, partial [Candidatus Micrarchaeota archaeon]|nr:hypothetical protein [Candidatus Micrarchaeota archaeon]